MWKTPSMQLRAPFKALHFRPLLLASFKWVSGSVWGQSLRFDETTCPFSSFMAIFEKLLVRLVNLQEKFDDLESQGIFQPPENLGITVEYLNPSFLIKKPNGGHSLVTAFADAGRYSKPQPSLLPDVDSILRTIAKWKYIIMSDLTSTFYQIPLAKSSMKYCGVVTPFRGVRVYTQSAMATRSPICKPHRNATLSSCPP